MNKRHADAIVLGGGAAGLFFAAEAGKRGRSVIVLERSNRPGRKLLISGGGRCNFTNKSCTSENYLSANPHFSKSALARYTADAFIRLVEQHRIPYHEKTLGQLFCDRSSQDILELLLKGCAAAGAQVITGASIQSVRKQEHFIVETGDITYTCSALIVATGGLSISKLGATCFGYDLARQFGLKVLTCRPALVPLLFSQPDRLTYGELAGVSLPVTVQANGQSFQEKMLITHRGLSGPAILQISSYWASGSHLSVDLLPGIDFQNHCRIRREAGSKALIGTLLAEIIPKRFAEKWLEVTPSVDTANQIDTALHRWSVLPDGTEGYEKAEVTAGGVDTNDLSSKTMEARYVPGLFFIGEVVDVTGWLGGYNFQWAWSSAFAAAQAL